MGYKHISDDDNADLLSYIRRQYSRSFWGIKPERHAFNPYAISRGLDYLAPQYDDAEAEILSQIPTDRFPDDELYVWGAIAFAYLTHCALTGTDQNTFSYSRVGLIRTITESEILVDGRPSNFKPMHWKLKGENGNPITRVLDTIEQTGWMLVKKSEYVPGQRKRQASRMEPRVDLSHILHSLPAVRSSAPALTVPTLLQLPLLNSPTLRVGSSGSGGSRAVHQTLSDRLQGH